MAINPVTGLEEDEIDPATGLPVAAEQAPAAPAAAPAAIDVRKYIAEKYGLGDQYSDEARQKLVQANEEAASPIASAFAGFGAGMRGGNVSDAFDSAMKGSQAKTGRALAEFDKGRAQKISDFDAAEKIRKSEREEKAIMDAKDVNSDRSKAAQQSLIEDYGMDPAIASKLTAEQAEARLPGLKAKLDRQMREREFDERMKDRQLQREQMQANRDVARQDKLSEGQKAVDKDFAKDLNDWTSGGKDRARNEIEKLKAVSKRLSENKGGTGGLTGVLGDRFTSNEVLKNRADVQQSAMTLIKQVLSGATSDKDREAIVNTLWNESDSTKNNMARINRFIQDMESRANSMDAKTSYFEKNGSLKGYEPGTKPSFPMKVRKEGQVATVNDENELKEAREEGWQ